MPSYTLNEIKLEKYRALLTRDRLQERDLFDLFLIPNSLKVDVKKVVEKIINSSPIKKNLEKDIEKRLNDLKEQKFFGGSSEVASMAIVTYIPNEFDIFKEKIKPLLIEICELFLKKE